MNDRTILTENSRDDGLPSEAKIDERIAEINLRQQKRRQIIEHLESGSIAEAWKTVVAAGIPLTDIPGLIEKYADNLRQQEVEIKKQSARIEEALTQVHQSIAEANSVFQLEKLLTVISQADFALEKLNIEQLRLSVDTIKQYRAFPEGQLGTITDNLIYETPEWLLTRLEELENDLTWLESRRHDQDFRNAQTDLRDWLEFVSNCNDGKSRLLLLRRQKMASLLTYYMGAEYPFEQRFLEIEELLLKGQPEQAQVQIDYMEQELDSSKTGLTPVEMLGIKNRILILKHYLSLYLEVRRSLSQAHNVFRAAKKPRGLSFPEGVRAMYAGELSSALQRLERDRQALPPFVKSCDLKGNKLSRHLDGAIKALENFDWGAKNG